MPTKDVQNTFSRKFTASCTANTGIFKGVGRHPKTGKKKGGIKVHTVIHANDGVPSDIKFTSAATNDSFMLKPAALNKGDIMAMDRAYIDYEKFEQLSERGVVYVVDEEKRKLISLLTNDTDFDPEEIVAIYRKRWEIELLLKQMKQNFPLKYFYGESSNAIKIQIWVTLIANLLLMVLQKGMNRQWSFSGLATMVRITLMYYVDFYSLFNNPEKDWENVLAEASEMPPELTLFD